MLEVVLEQANEFGLIRVVEHDEVFAVAERPRVRDVHLVDEDERPRRDGLEEPKVALPVRRVRRDDDLGVAHRREVRVVDLAAPRRVDLARDAAVRPLRRRLAVRRRRVAVEKVADPAHDARARGLFVGRPVRAEHVERSVGAVLGFGGVKVRVGDRVRERVVVPRVSLPRAGVRAVLLGDPRAFEIDEVVVLGDLGVHSSAVALVEDDQVGRRRAVPRRRRIPRRDRQVEHELGLQDRRDGHDRRVRVEPRAHQVLEPPPRLGRVGRHEMHVRRRHELELGAHARRDPVELVAPRQIRSPRDCFGGSV
mmetsp:Transcript_13616/g.54596  ORF Transcript_13616/g.54596 Transcript_13616/m.54596 type:complete len:309 (+) Transcript_13616:628-1554(+)